MKVLILITTDEYNTEAMVVDNTSVEEVVTNYYKEFN